MPRNGDVKLDPPEKHLVPSSVWTAHNASAFGCVGQRRVLAAAVVGAMLESSASGDDAMTELSGTILVTGATGGIGLAVCDRLARGGASLLLAACDVDKLQSLCAQLPHSNSGGHQWISVDMTRDDQSSSLPTS